MNSMEKLTEWQKRLEEMKAERERAKGAMEQLMERLKKDFGCTDLSQAYDKIVEMEKRIAEMEAALAESVKAFSEKYGPLLSQTD